MIRRYLNIFGKIDWILLAAVLLLMCFGLAAIYSIEVSFDNPDLGNFKKQLLFAAVGLMGLFTVAMFNYHLFEDGSPIFYAIMAIVLVAVLLFGRTIQGTTGWFSVAGFNIQPVEFGKIALLLFLARYLSHNYTRIREMKHFIISGCIAALYFGLVMLQPDFGSAMMLVAIWLGMVFFAGASKKHLLLLAVMGLVAFVVAWGFFFQEYQKDRIMTFFNPQADPYGRGYHVRQAVTAVGAGQLMGRGLGFGSQSQLKFIPASQTDFIFAVIAEELGFLGVTLVILLWAVIFYRLVRAVKQARDGFSIMFILGVSALFFAQIMINIGMNIGIVPVTGISLPFVSYGGSFLITSLLLIGLVQSMILRNR